MQKLNGGVEKVYEYVYEPVNFQYIPIWNNAPQYWVQKLCFCLKLLEAKIKVDLCFSI